MPETNVELNRDRMELLRNETRTELVAEFHKQKMLSRAARKAGHPAQAAIHSVQADLYYKMIGALDVPPNEDPYADSDHIQETAL